MPQSIVNNQENRIAFIVGLATEYKVSLSQNAYEMWAHFCDLYHITLGELEQAYMIHKTSDKAHFMLETNEVFSSIVMPKLRYAFNTIYRTYDDNACLLFPDGAMAYAFLQEFGSYIDMDIDANTYQRERHFDFFVEFYNVAIAQHVKHPAWIYEKQVDLPTRFIQLGHNPVYFEMLQEEAMEAIKKRNHYYERLAAPEVSPEVEQEVKDFFAKILNKKEVQHG